MKTRFFAVTTGIFGTFLTLMILIGLAFPVAAAPPRQGGDDSLNLPTPTPAPVLSVSYELSVVGGQAETLTFASEEYDNVTLSNITAFPNYPRGVEFTATITPKGDLTIDAVNFFVRYVHGDRSRVPTTYDPDTNQWSAHPWATGDGQPAWTPFEFYWSITTSDGVTTQTTAHPMDYADPNREWFRVETPHIIIYWFGFGEDNVTQIAEDIATAMASTHERRVIGFGGDLGYKPVGVLFPSDEALAEMYGSGATNSNAAGFTSDDLGMTVQEISIPSEEWYERLKDCVWLTPREERTMEGQIRGAIFGTIPHEVTHLFQYEFGVLRGPLWWTEGQADYFTHSGGLYDRRLRYLASVDPNIPILATEIVGSNNIEADGCYALAYDVGASFINWMLTNYGGIELHARITEAMSGNTAPQDAIEIATGKTFFELENEWRAYIGFNQLSEADVNPEAALQPAIEPVFAVGDSVTVPGFRTMAMADAPGSALGQMPCFAGTQVTILKSGSLENINYYQVDCQGNVGWVQEAQLNQ